MDDEEGWGSRRYEIDPLDVLLAGQGPVFRDMARGYHAQGSRALLAKSAPVDDPDPEGLATWAWHVALDSLQVPPCLRFRNLDLDRRTPQEQYLLFMADLLWVARRNKGHKVEYSRWRGVVKHPPHSMQWLKTCTWIYTMGHAVGYYHAKGLGLKEKQLQPLVTMRPRSMQGNQALLDRLPEIEQKILTHARSKPDRAGIHSPEDIAARRAEAFRLYLLAGRVVSIATEYFRLTTGCSISRQALTSHIKAARAVAEPRTLRGR